MKKGDSIQDYNPDVFFDSLYQSTVGFIRFLDEDGKVDSKIIIKDVSQLKEVALKGRGKHVILGSGLHFEMQDSDSNSTEYKCFTCKIQSHCDLSILSYDSDLNNINVVYDEIEICRRETQLINEYARRDYLRQALQYDFLGDEEYKFDADILLDSFVVDGTLEINDSMGIEEIGFLILTYQKHKNEKLLKIVFLVGE